MDLMCDILEVSRSGFYAWLERPASLRRRRQEEVLASIRQSHQESRSIYGSPRICRELQERGVKACENTVAKLMKAHGIRSKIKRRFVVRTTDSNHAHPIAPNRLNRAFDQAASRLRVWTSDITYVHTDEGWLVSGGGNGCLQQKDHRLVDGRPPGSELADRCIGDGVTSAEARCGADGA